jgi:RNA polymerase sigma factor (sigma-70 family)
MSDEVIPHLFRTEYRKITNVLCKLFGFEHIENAEDIASETFLSAAETWGLNGTPHNPRAWLYAVAKNKAKNFLKRELHFHKVVSPQIQRGSANASEIEIDLSEQNMNDSQLQVMFAVCHPSISAEAQIGLSLRILCGFGIDEIADAFLTSKDTINKRLFRAKEKLREEHVKIELPDPVEIERRLETVLTTLYLLFNEGYYSTSNKNTLRKDLCLEAIRLTHLLTEYDVTNKATVNALLSLMCFHASRFEARMDQQGEMILYEDQDRDLWNEELIDKGQEYLIKAATGDYLSKYHIEAAIAYWHTRKTDKQKKWDYVLQLYNQLLQIEYSPMAALNRTYALSKANGKQEAIVEAKKLDLTDNHFYFALLGELYTDIDNQVAKQNFQTALSLAKTEPERHAIQKKIDKLDYGD